MSEVDRRTLLLLFSGVAAAGMTGCGEPEPPRAALARVFGLQGEQVRWLDRLNDEQAAELWSALNSSSLATSRTVDLIARVLLPRSHVLAFVGYGTVANQTSVCDGLFRENA